MKTKLKENWLLIVTYNLLYHVPKYDWAMCLHLCLRARRMKCCRGSCWYRCPCLSALTLRREADVSCSEILLLDVMSRVHVTFYVWRNLSIITNGRLTNLSLIHNDDMTWHGMMTSSNGSIFRVTGPLCGEFTGPGEFPAQRPVTRSFDVFFDLRLNKDWVNNRETGDLRRHRGHCDVNVMENSLRFSVCGDFTRKPLTNVTDVERWVSWLVCCMSAVE